MHRDFILSLVIGGLLAAVPPQLSAAPSKGVTLTPIGTYASGVYDESAAEIVGHDPASQRLYIVNARDNRLDILSITNPAYPTLAGSLSLLPYGGVANCVAIRAGLVAVAVENVVKTDPGQVVFFDTDLNYLAHVQVGALPDMLTFSPNGRYVVVANEGEPNFYNHPDSVDPEGTISIIDIGGGVAKAKVRTAHFRAFNEATLDPTIRIFGPGATVAQDLEPEYVAISDDSKTAWVTCQENNAIATVDLVSGRVIQLVGLGFKDHGKVNPARAFVFDPAQLPSIGTTLGNQELFLGGFSGLAFEGIAPGSGRYRFVTHTDRGPNAEATGIYRPFLLPDFAPEIVRFELDPGTGELFITERIPLQRAPGDPLTGLPNTSFPRGTGNTPYNDEVPVDLLGNELPLDPLGADLEGIVIDPRDASFWMVDEYRPSIYHFSKTGILIERYVPEGTAAALGEPPGTFGMEVLPAVLAQRRQNRGFEALAYDGGRLYAFVQSPLRNPTSLSNGTLGSSKNVRVVEFDPATLATRQFIYLLDNLNLGPSRGDKIGDATGFGDGEFLIVERDDDSYPATAPKDIEKKVYRFTLAGATDVSGLTGTVGATGKTIDELSRAELLANGIRPIDKVLQVDLNWTGYNTVQKVEGLAVLDRNTIALINDNDFGVASISINDDGTFEPNPDYVPEPEILGIVDLRMNRLDASDSDGAINLQPWPVKGMYGPDGIAAYRVGKNTFLVTANEGDAREYTDPDDVTYNEVARVRNVDLDAVAFPDGSTLKTRPYLGQLNITTTLGKNAAGKHEELYAFGGRSFSIRNVDGTLVFDSGDELERITALANPTRFNASNSNNTFDNRSDDKGPEPEGVVIGRAYGRQYAFLGLERVGGVVTYDISDPLAPFFVDYVNFRDFTKPTNSPEAGDLGPEGIIFIKAEDSPIGIPLVVIGNEVSGTTTLFAVEQTGVE